MSVESFSKNQAESVQKPEFNNSSFNDNRESVLVSARQKLATKLMERASAREAISAHVGILNPFAHLDKDNNFALNALTFVAGPLLVAPTIALTEGPGNLLKSVRAEIGTLREKMRVRNLEKKFGSI